MARGQSVLSLRYAADMGKPTKLLHAPVRRHLLALGYQG